MATKRYIQKEVVNGTQYLYGSDAKITIQKNGTKVDDFTLDQLTNKNINIPVPTKTSELTNDAEFITIEDVPEGVTVDEAMSSSSENPVQNKVITAALWNKQDTLTPGTWITITNNTIATTALPGTTKYGASVDLTLNTTDYKLTLTLKDQDGTTLNSKTVDFPIESVVVGGSYDSTNQKIVLTLQNGTTIDVPIGDLVAWLQTEITSTNKLDADLVDDTNQAHKFVTAAEKTKLANTSGTNSGDETTASIKTKLGQASTSGDGYLSSTDWNKFNGKADTDDIGNATITVKQAGVSKGSFGTNQDTAGEININGIVYVTQAEYNALPSSKATDGNTYKIVEEITA